MGRGPVRSNRRTIVLVTHPVRVADLRLYIRRPAPNTALFEAADTVLHAPESFMQRWSDQNGCIP